MKKKKILKIWPIWVPGIRYHDHYLSDEMKSDDVLTYFIQPRYTPAEYKDFTGKNERFENLYNASFLDYFLFFGKPVPYRLYGFVKFIKKLNPDVVHIFGISNFTTVFALIALRVAKYKNKVIFNDHSDPNERKTGFFSWCYYKFFNIFYLFLLKGRYSIIVPDSATKFELISRYGQSILHLVDEVPLGYNHSIFNSDNNFRNKEGPLIIGFAGKINPKKNLEQLILASMSFKKDEIEIRLAGFNNGELSAYQKSFLEYIESFDRKNIHGSGFFSDPLELSKFYSNIDVAVYPGSISITTLEASGCGTPVIIYDSYPGLQHRVDSNRGYLFKTQEELVSLIEFYLNLKRKGSIDHVAISRNSYRYSWAAIKNHYYYIYGFTQHRPVRILQV